VFYIAVTYRIHDWHAPNVEGGGRHPSQPIHYAGVLGNALYCVLNELMIRYVCIDQAG